MEPSGTLVGPLLPDLTAELGLTRPPGVVTGGHDQACGALGVGLTVPGLASVSTGTAEVVEVVLPSPVVSQPLYEGNISVYGHVVPDLFLAMTLNHSGGLALRWFRDGFCEPQVTEAGRAGVDAYDTVLAGASPDPTDLLVLPHFSGSGTPTFDTASRGAILGLTFATTRTDIAKAILEGLTYELRLNLDLLQAGGVRIDVLRAIGGGARSGLWLQLKADITGIPVVTPRVTEAAAFGAALLAGVGAGVFPSAAEAAGRFLRLTDTYTPDPTGTRRTPAGSSSTGRSTRRSRPSRTGCERARDLIGGVRRGQIGSAEPAVEGAAAAQRGGAGARQGSGARQEERRLVSRSVAWGPGLRSASVRGRGAAGAAPCRGPCRAGAGAGPGRVPPPPLG